MADLLRRERITHWTTTPAIPAQMDPAGLPDLEVLAVAGEVCPPELAARWGVDRTVLNLYGPTEVTVWATATEPLVPGSRPTIGRPIEGVSAVVLDRFLQPVPAGWWASCICPVPGWVADTWSGRVRARHVSSRTRSRPTCSACIGPAISCGGRRTTSWNSSIVPTIR